MPGQDPSVYFHSTDLKEDRLRGGGSGILGFEHVIRYSKRKQGQIKSSGVLGKLWVHLIKS